MSRPYININSSSYDSATDVITFDVTALRLRGETSLTVGGFTQSRTISLTDGRYLTDEVGYFTFSANVNGTSSNNLTGANGVVPTFTPATAEFTFGGTAAIGTNIKMQVWGSSAAGKEENYNLFGVGGYTFSAVQGATTSVNTLKANIGSLPTGATATTSGATLIITAPASTGAYYNGNTAKIGGTNPQAVLGASGFTFSGTYYTGPSWSGGVTTITVPVTATNFGQLETQIFNLS